MDKLLFFAKLFKVHNFKGKGHSCPLKIKKRTLLYFAKKKDSSVGKRTLLSKKGHFCPVDFRFLKIGLKRTLLSTQGSADWVACHLYPHNVKTTMNNPNSNRNPPATPTPAHSILTTLHSNTYVRAKTAD